MARRPSKNAAPRGRPARRGGLFSAIPSYFWLAAAYGAVVVSQGGLWSSGPASAGDAAAPSLGAAMQAYLDTPVFSAPVVAGDSLPITMTLLFVLGGFACSWIEVFRAMRQTNRALNDVGSILVTIPLIVLLVGVEAFQTTAFLIIAFVGFADVILDRLIQRSDAAGDYSAA